MPDNSLKVPNHIGLILDGNRRWAKQRGLPTLEGHRRGYKILKKITQQAFDSGVNYVSAYVFSTENWNRSKKEVNYLMDLILNIFTSDLEEFKKKNIKITWLGSNKMLSNKIVKAINNTVESTKNNTNGTLALCFNYGGRDEIVDAVKSIVGKGYKSDEINQQIIEKYLYEPSVPPIDIMVRTSGEQRISNFMLWRIAYSELMFVKKHWPDFSSSDLKLVLSEYNKRQRRYGA